MKQIYPLALSMSLLALGANAAVPFSKGETPPAATKKIDRQQRLRAPQEQVLIDEDFSRFTGGTEDVPGAEIEYVNDYHIPDELMAQPDWTGGGIFPTAGSIALMDRTNDERLGFISTPPLYLAGTATLTFRARTLPGHSGGSLWIALCDDYYGPGEDSEDFILTDEWTEYTMVATHGADDELSYFQIQAENGYVQLDDVKISFKRDRLPTPFANKARNISPTEFVANWEDVGAPLYRLNVLCKAQPENVVSGEITESFDGINVNADGKTINADNPNYPEGWTFDLSSNGSQDVTTEDGWFNSAPLALKFDMPGDVITSPETPEPLDMVSFWVRPSSMNDTNGTLSMIRVEIFHTFTQAWEVIAHLPYYWMEEKGSFYVIEGDALGEDANRVRLSMIQRGNLDFFIDDVTLSYSTKGVTTNYIKDLDVEGTEYTVSDINPDNEYTYYVQAIDDDLISGISNPVWVDGIVGLKPEVLEPTDKTVNSFTANWNHLGHATDYKVETNTIIRADKDMPGTVVLEESFDAILSDGMDWVTPYNFAEYGMATTGWCATQPIWKTGMAGTQGTSWIGVAGLVYSPYLNLSCNNNEGFNVEATVVTTSDYYYDQEGNAYPEGVFVMVLDTYTDNRAKAFALIETPKAGEYTASVTVPNPDKVDLSNVIVAFMSMSGTSFFVDDVRILQDIKAGETLTAPYAISFTNNTSQRFENLTEARDYEYTVTASAYKNFENYVSEPSDRMNVPLSTVGVKGVEASAQGVSISAGNGIISVTADSDTAISIIAANGTTVAASKGSLNAAVEAGIYVVKAGDVTRKIAVRK
jgi:hypothetical protein